MIVKVLGYILLGILSTVWSGLVFTVLWGWFAEEITGVSMSIPVSLGLMLLVRMSSYWPRDLEDTSDDYQTRMIKAFVIPLVFLAFGYIYQLFI